MLWGVGGEKKKEREEEEGVWAFGEGSIMGMLVGLGRAREVSLIRVWGSLNRDLCGEWRDLMLLCSNMRRGRRTWKVCDVFDR